MRNNYIKDIILVFIIMIFALLRLTFFSKKWN
jgi:hypothetical protein